MTREKVASHYLQVIIPALNEEQGIAYTITELKDCLDEAQILVVDGKSTDNTVHVAKDMGANVVFQEGRGKGDALNLGFKYIAEDTIYVAISDADYTYPAAYIPEMIKMLEKDPKIGMVCGNRFNDTNSDKVMNKVYYFGNKVIAKVHSVLNGVPLNDPLTGLRAIRAEILRDWHPLSKEFDIEVELNSYVEQRGYEILEIPISYRPRLGEKKLKMSDGIKIIKRIIQVSILYNKRNVPKIS